MALVCTADSTRNISASWALLGLGPTQPMRARDLWQVGTRRPCNVGEMIECSSAVCSVQSQNVSLWLVMSHPVQLQWHLTPHLSLCFPEFRGELSRALLWGLSLQWCLHMTLLCWCSLHWRRPPFGSHSPSQQTRSHGRELLTALTRGTDSSDRHL